MLLVILAIWFGYKKAKATGRNPFLWAAVAGLTYAGVQLLVGMAFGVAIGLGIELLGWPESTYDDLTWLITIVAIAASLLSIYLLFRYLDRVPTDDEATPPPPPPTFEQNDQP
jgi:hypothetical protein